MRFVNGFSLIEVLVALSVIAVGMSAALSVTNSAIDTYSSVEKRTYAHWVAEDVLTAFKLRGQVAAGEQTGEHELAGRTWYWRADIQTTDDADILVCNLTVATDEALEDEQAKLTSYLRALEVTENN